jgi:hypothetical protein
MKYIVCKGDSADDLMKVVNANLQMGWSLQGGVFVYIHPIGMVMFMQAMVSK